MSEIKTVGGISRSVFIAGIIIAILASSAVSTVVSMQWAKGPQGNKGDKGDKGDTGAIGPQGLQGLQGPKGDKGDTGVTGLQGFQGIQGLQGPQGEPGKSIKIVSTYSEEMISTNSIFPNMVDMSEMSVAISINETSNLLIMFSGETLPGYNETIYVRALVGEQSANPSVIYLTPTVERLMVDESCFVGWGSQTFNFYMPSVATGTYLVKIQWCIQNHQGDIFGRTLNVIALSTQ